MKARTVARHTRESFKSLLRNGWMTFASVSAVTITLILVGVFFVIMMNLNHVATSIEENVEIRVHIDVAATKEEKSALEEEIKGIPEVGSVIFSPKGEELDNLITSLGEDGDAFKLFEQDNPLNDVFVVKTKDPEDTLAVVKKIEKFEHVAKVRYGQGTVEKLFSAINLSRNVGIVLIIGLLFTAMFLISNTIKITIVARRKEIEIMRLVGATNWFIRWPFFLEGMWLGLLGSIIPIAAVSAIYYYAYQFLIAKLAGSYIKILDYTPFVFQVSGLLLVMGAVIGIWGSVMSIRKFLRV
ncbi:ABC transporter permease [Niallia circulans]|jgi:cell division transport system permease protein|uniref:Cell division protein FtsX n=1 Tax=Niallia circulans TaxID=1397 RepID=A0A0J1L3C5_NIACI|nr:permease-like cell division protein FtsX [Niallia circulans]KLV23470.1 cell division protein FtsX [Niallia circulans]MCM2981999.1 permease-like cell division protein FtsX [Niallia circulans]MDR4316270.1 ABC transporter permease [Niallia circulans]MED3838559.1 permease-like cell division protein FtsX [Niallia circulans]MED4244033.1 permease-like cell division protein FtsX [Niallia circulans]